MSADQAPPPKPPKHASLSRAEARALNALERAGAEGEDRAVQRDHLIERLLHIPGLDPDEERLIALLADPQNLHRGLAQLCSDSGFSVARMLKLLQRAEGARALMGAIGKVYARGEQVAEDTMELATIRTFTCTECSGTGEVQDPKAKDSKADKLIRCESCGGRGKHVREPSVAQQKLAHQLMGLVVQGSGTTINLQQNATANANSQANASQQTALVDHSFMDALRANTDAAVRHARGLRPGVIPAALLPEGGGASGDLLEVRHEAQHEFVSEAASAPRPVAPAVVASAPAPPPEPAPGRAVIPALGIPGGVRRPPPTSGT